MAIVVFRMYAETPYVVESLRPGAKACVSKESSVDELACAIRHAASGRQYIDSRLRDQASDAVFEASPRGHHALSRRETEVLHLMVEGKRTGEIAEVLAVSAKTVSTYRTRILEKMNMATNHQIVRHVLQRRLARGPRAFMNVSHGGS